MENNNYRNNNNSQQHHSGYPNTNARISYYIHNNNPNATNYRNQRKKNQQRNNENQFLLNTNRNALSNINRNQQQYSSLPHNFINNYVTNVTTPTLPEMSNSYDSSMPLQQQQQNLNNFNRSPNKHNFNNKNHYNNYKGSNKNNQGGRVARSNSNHNIKENVNTTNQSPNLEHSPRGVRSSPSDSAISAHLTTSDEFNAILNEIRNSPSKLSATFEETKVVMTTSRPSTLNEPIFNQNNEQIGTVTMQTNNSHLYKEETVAKLNTEANSEVLASINTKIESSESSKVEKEYEYEINEHRDEKRLSMKNENLNELVHKIVNDVISNAVEVEEDNVENKQEKVECTKAEKQQDGAKTLIVADENKTVDNQEDFELVDALTDEELQQMQQLLITAVTINEINTDATDGEIKQNMELLTLDTTPTTSTTTTKNVENKNSKSPIKKTTLIPEIDCFGCNIL